MNRAVATTAATVVAALCAVHMEYTQILGYWGKRVFHMNDVIWVIALLEDVKHFLPLCPIRAVCSHSSVYCVAKSKAYVRKYTVNLLHGVVSAFVFS